LIAEPLHLAEEIGLVDGQARSGAVWLEQPEGGVVPGLKPRVYIHSA
jgi:hypothetical protein